MVPTDGAKHNQSSWYLVWHHDSPLVESDPRLVLNHDMIPEFVPWKAEMDPSWAFAVPEPDDESDDDEVAAGAAAGDDDDACCCREELDEEAGVLLALEEEEGVTTALALEELDELPEVVLALQYPDALFVFFFKPPLRAGLPCCLLLRIGSP